MALSIGIVIRGTRKNKKQIHGFFKLLNIAKDDMIARSGIKIAEKIKGLAKSYAPKATGKLADAIQIVQHKKGDPRGTWMVTVGNIKRWGSDKSEKARKVYPIAQERGYKPHNIHINMIPAEVRERFRLGNQGYVDAARLARGGKFIHVKKFTPYMMPALFHSAGEIKGILRTHLTKMFNKLRGHKYAGNMNPLNLTYAKRA